jgi:hypothetical protein
MNVWLIRRPHQDLGELLIANLRHVEGLKVLEMHPDGRHTYEINLADSFYDFEVTLAPHYELIEGGL